MQVNCTGCDKQLNIPDEKVPKDQAFTITCPHCKAKVRVDQHLKTEEPEPPQEDVIDTFTFVASDDFEDDEVLEIYEEGDKVALVLDHENEDFWIETLSGLDYKLQSAKSPEHAVHKLKFTQFDLVILHEEFGTIPFKENPIYQYIINLPMSQRRTMFVALAGDQFRSTNNMEAYALSVNVVINKKDFEKSQVILKKTINDNQNFYRVYRDSLKAHGKV